MCGICGFYGLEDKVLLKRMSDIISHRGPDDSGFYTDKNVGLAMRRLKIIDLRTGKQPIYNEDNSVSIVFNGEIYNYRKLREELERKGHRFYTNTDTETIVHSYEEYGEECIHKLDGMFAFAIWDSKKKQLFMARDRFGKKPLYYFYNGKFLLFSSEMKSLLLSNMVRREIDMQCLHDFLSFRYVPEPNTLLKHVKKLPPAHYMIVGKNKFLIRKYWDLVFSAEGSETDDYYIKKFSEILENAVKKRLMSDVPLGLYLSGGIDSNAVLSFMAKNLKEPVNTFTIGYSIKEFPDETKQATEIADYYGANHRNFIVDDNPLDVMPHVVWHMDEPIADPTALPIYLLSKLTKKHVTVILNGEGADEILAGYEHYKIINIANKYLPYAPSLLRRNIIPTAVNSIPPKILDKFFSYASSLGEEGKKRFFDLLVNYKDTANAYMILNSIFTENEKAEIYYDKNLSGNLEKSVSAVRPYFSNGKKNSSKILTELLKCDIHTFMRHWLIKTDKMTMAHSIEARVPYLDVELAEFSSKLPSHLKLNGSIDKYILRMAMKNKIPDSVVKRKKQRFFVPVHLWFKNAFKDSFVNLFSDSTFRKRKLFDKRYIDKIINNFGRSQLYYGRQIWSLLNLELWMRIYIDQDDVSRPKLKLNDLMD